ncbi:hypothetical protein ASF98_04995 [Arthrobacter sp. Leaf337]|uniref:hypothetical protein n=1 Tax=unclassified Arthrobacter TaxID=235627 RepID=UPI0006FAF92F|nr:hypothetical protein [Arthrobacter sp. Leaf337]KQR75198.1 hypothetical protein ASF98_04995 [Arthrobacter sp. Leaf337]
MTRQQLALLMNGDADPLLVISSASTSELQALTDALFRDLDTSHPVFGAQVWYDLALEELENRNNGASPQADDLADSDAFGAA